MIAPSRGAAYRRFYLYSALSVTVIALAIAVTLLLREGLQLVGFGVRSIPADVSRAVALSVALVAFAVPVGSVHLWLILRSLRDPIERANGIRHQFLNLWVAFAVLAELIAGTVLINDAANATQVDVTGQVSVMIVVAIVGAIAAWWIGRTPPTSPQHRVRAGVAVMLISMAVAAFSLANAASAAGLFAFPYAAPSFYPRGYDPTPFQQQTLRSSYLDAGLALAVWSLGYVWQRPFQETRDRLGYALAGYGIGTLLLLAGAAYGIAGAIRFARDPAQAAAFTGAWPAIAAGSLLVILHAVMLLGYRGRNGHPAVTTTRLLLAFPALVGLGIIVGGLGLAAHALVERDAVPAQHLVDDLTHAVTLVAVGLLAYVPSSLGFNARTTAGSAVRRFYLFSVVCLTLIAGLASGVVVLYSAITAVAGVGQDAARTALTWIVPAVTLAALFAAHLGLLLRDQRATRAAESATTADPLVALLEEVRAGRVSVERAAATIRGPVA